MTAWDTQLPVSQGLEWHAMRSGFEALDGVGDCIAQTFRSTIAETIAQLKVYGSSSGSANGVILEVFTAGSEVATGLATTLFDPNGQANVGAGVFSACSPHYTCLNGAGIVHLPTGNSIDLEYGTAGVAGRVINLSVQVKILGTGTLSVSMVRVSDGAVRSLGDYPGSGILWSGLSGIDPPTIVIPLGEINPFTDQPWTTAEVQGFDNATYRLRFLATTSDPAIGLNLARLKVDTCTENRLVRRLFAPAAAPTWHIWDAYKPDGTALWAKAANVDYTVALRHPLGGVITSGAVSRFAPFWADSAVTPPHGKSSWKPTISGLLANAAVIVSMGSPLTRGYAVAPIIVTSGNVSRDGLPFAKLATVAVDINQRARQEVTVTGGPVTVGAMSVICRPELPLSTPPVDPLRLALRSAVGTGLAVAEIGAVDWANAPEEEAVVDANPNGLPWKRVVVPLNTTVALTDATQYRLEASNFAPVDAPSWETAFFSIEGLTNSGGAATYTGAAGGDGATDQGWLLLGASEIRSTSDYPFEVLTLAPTVTGFTVTEATAPTAVTGTGFSICGEAPGTAAIPYALLDWSRTALGSDPVTGFAYYEVQRRTASDDWRVVGRLCCDPNGVIDESRTEWPDYEAPLNRPVTYRVRVVRNDGGIGGWSAERTVTLRVDTDVGVGYQTFTSNRDPTLNMAYIDVYAGDEANRDWEFLDAAQHAYDGLFGVDYWVDLHETERRGVRFTRRLLLNAVAAPDGELRGLNRFRTVRRLQETTVPYVCVRSNDGDVVYGSVVVPNGRERQPSHLYTATVTVTETTATPTVETVAR